MTIKDVVEILSCIVETGCIVTSIQWNKAKVQISSFVSYSKGAQKVIRIQNLSNEVNCVHLKGKSTSTLMGQSSETF